MYTYPICMMIMKQKDGACMHAYELVHARADFIATQKLRTTNSNVQVASQYPGVCNKMHPHMHHTHVLPALKKNHPHSL